MDFETALCLPAPQIKTRPYNQQIFDTLIAAGHDPIFARIVAGRSIAPRDNILESIQPGLSMLDNPNQLKDGLKAAARIADAIIQGDIIGIETDHDCDGQTAHAVIWTALVEYFGHPEHLVQSYIGHRLEEGYGLSDSLAQRILANSPRPQVVITADNGSSDEPRIHRLQQAGITVIVTDHHGVPAEGPPPSAFAVVNPTQTDCPYPDKAIAGCMVAWHLMVLVRQRLLEVGWSISQTAHMGALFDFVAVGTVADCVSLATSLNNRAVVRYGISQIQKWQRPCWQALRQILPTPVTAEALAFQVAPLLNSDGRLSDALGAVSFLLTKTLEEAQNWLTQLVAQNQSRKAIQRHLTRQGFYQASQQVQAGKWSLSIALSEGHPGVHGISASRIKDAFGRPTIIFSEKYNTSEALLTGSARSIDGIHIRTVLQTVDERHPALIRAFGGHKGAAGLTIRRQDFEAFSAAFECAIRDCASLDKIGPCLWTDGEIDVDGLNVKSYQQLLARLEPFGREFDPPIFSMSSCECLEVKPLGDGTHCRLKLKWLKNAKIIEAVWFQCRLDSDTSFPVAVGQVLHIAFRLVIDNYQGFEQLKYQIVGAA